MALSFIDQETTRIANGGLVLPAMLNTLSASEFSTIINSSKDSTGIEVRMLPPLIINNHTPEIWPFPGYSNLYCLIIVVSDVTNQLAGQIDLKGFARIGHNERLPINKTIFYWQSINDEDKAPNQIHVFCSVVKSKGGLRDVGKVMADAKDDPDYKKLNENLVNIAKDTASLNGVIDILTQIAGIVGKYLGGVEDKPLGTIINSYTTLNGDFDKLGVSQFIYPTRDVNFEFQMVVRNQQVASQISEKASRTVSDKISKPQFEFPEPEMVQVDMQSL